uniref:Uncharacterized protein n=1 Tax=Anopheles darlingi TaxID=43151 RepID=A0A2M4DI77_ANODA
MRSSRSRSRSVVASAAVVWGWHHLHAVAVLSTVYTSFRRVRRHININGVRYTCCRFVQPEGYGGRRRDHEAISKYRFGWCSYCSLVL